MSTHAELAVHLGPLAQIFNPRDLLSQPKAGFIGPNPAENVPNYVMENLRYTLQFIYDEIIFPMQSDIGATLRIGVTSGYRSPEYNSFINGASSSQHMFGRAVDINLPGNLELLKKYSDAAWQRTGASVNMGLGFYNSFVHVDTSAPGSRGRTSPYTWIRVNGVDQPRIPGTNRVAPSKGIAQRASGEGYDGSFDPSFDVIFDSGVSKTLSIDPQELSKFMTPEEFRKGMIPQIYYVNDWHLTQLVNPDNTQQRREIENIQQDNATRQLEEMNANQTTVEQPVKKNNSNDNQRGDLSLDPRRLYVMSLVNAEFYRRRFANRSIPAVTGPFNPFPVAGFPGLILDPGRPVIAHITSVSHNISVQGASGSTSVGLSGPRYWDEGDVWYWFGGNERGGDAQGPGMSQEDAHLYKRFPQWHNMHTIATNNWDSNTGRKNETSNLDRFYQFMLGCEGVEYLSNNHDKTGDPEKVRRAIRDRDPSDFEVSPETLEIKDYNIAIASLDENERFAPGTIAHSIWGGSRPYDKHESSYSVEKQIEYCERYGVSEKELLEDFLGNKYWRHKGRLILTGPTFGTTGDKVNALQDAVIKYMEDLENRNLETKND